MTKLQWQMLRVQAVFSLLSVLQMIWVCRERVVRVAICGYAGCGTRTRDAGLDGGGFGLTWGEAMRAGR